MDHQLNITCRTVYMNIRKMKRIRGYLTELALRTFVQHTSQFTSRLDYCNSLYNGLALASQLARNQIRGMHGWYSRVVVNT